MPAHVFIPLLAVGSLLLTVAFVAVLQPRVRWLRWIGGGIIISTVLTFLSLYFLPVPS